MGNLIMNACRRKVLHELGERQNQVTEEIMPNDNTALRDFESHLSTSGPFIFQEAMHLERKQHRRYKQSNVHNKTPEMRSFGCNPIGPKRPQTLGKTPVDPHQLYHYRDSPGTTVYPTNHSSPQWHDKNQLCLNLTEERPTYPDLCPHPHQSALHLAVTAGRPQRIPDLLRKGVSINSRIKSGQTALHLASKLLNQEAIGTLLGCGADINLATAVTKETALHLAVWSSSCKAGVVLAAGDKCVKLLLHHGANVHLKDWLGREAIHTACSNGRNDIVHLLLDYEADANSLTELHESPLFLLLEKENGLRQAEALKRLLTLSYPLKLTNYEGRLPRALSHPRHRRLRCTFTRALSEVLSLQDICKFNVRKIYKGNMKERLKGFLPASLWHSIYINQEFSYASKIDVS